MSFNKPTLKTSVAETSSSSKTAPASIPPARPLRTLREKLLKKTTEIDRLTPPPQSVNPSDPDDTTTAASMTAKSFPEITAPRSNYSARSNISAHSIQPDPTNSAYQIVASWRQEDIPPRSIVSDDDPSFPGSPVSEVGRPSLLINSGKRLGVEMVMATREANEMLLRDSRSRHKQNLERERSRNAQELVRVERAHNKLVTGLIKDLASELVHARTDIKTNLQETRDVRSWLEYETRVPFQKATEAQKAAGRRKEARGNP
ncbi:unnamed protein product, partial [Iphiclides podalirius]